MGRRNVKFDATNMVTSGYLCIAANGKLRLTATAPRLTSNEIAVKLEIRFPRSLFKKPFLNATIHIPDNAGNPSTIKVETVNQIKNAVKQATGMDLAVNVVKYDDK